MKKLLALAASLSLLAGSTLAFSNAASAQSNVRGWGAVSCGNYLTTFEEGDENTKLIQIVSLYTWIEGYLSGQNFDRPMEQQRDLSSVEFEKTIVFFSEVCSQFPDVFIVFVADSLYEQLPLVQVAGDV